MKNNPTPEAHAQEPILTAAEQREQLQLCSKYEVELHIAGATLSDDLPSERYTVACLTIRQLAAALEHVYHCSGHCSNCDVAYDLLRRYNDGK